MTQETQVQFFHSATVAAARSKVFPRLQAKTRVDIIKQQVEELIFMIRMTKRLPSLLENTKEFNKLRFILSKFDQQFGAAFEEILEEWNTNHRDGSINDTPVTESLNADTDDLSEEEQVDSESGLKLFYKGKQITQQEFNTLKSFGIIQ
ncbi:MAG: hypothetical protein ACXADS_15390 [Candidatus Thorarchaeota archaeon]|jgi:hypothetical protein